METKLAPGFHVRPGRAVDTLAYDRFIGRWSRLFVPLVLGAANVQPGDQVLDVATGTGEAAVAIMPVIGPSGRLIGADIAPAMLEKCTRPIKGAGLSDGGCGRASVAIREWHLAPAASHTRVPAGRPFIAAVRSPAASSPSRLRREGAPVSHSQTLSR